jgi:putative ABC transport system ATP-binding protein
MDWRSRTLLDMERELHTRTKSAAAAHVVTTPIMAGVFGMIERLTGRVGARQIRDAVGMRELIDYLCLLEVAAGAGILPEQWPPETRDTVLALTSNNLVVRAYRDEKLVLPQLLRARLADGLSTAYDRPVPIDIFQWFLDLTIPLRRDRYVRLFLDVARRGQISTEMRAQRGLARFLWYLCEINQLLKESKECEGFATAVWHSHSDWAAGREQIQQSLTKWLRQDRNDSPEVNHAVDAIFSAAPSTDSLFGRGSHKQHELATMVVRAYRSAERSVDLPSSALERPRTLIALQGISKVFLTDEVETHALSDIQLEINRGEYVAIAGPSGSGKSTLLSVLGLLDSPTDGTYLLNGTQVANLSLSERARVRNREIGFIFQSFNLIGDLTVLENVELPLTYRGLKADERRARANAALERVGMSHRAKHLPSQLSGGQQQRVAVARAVAGDPAILLADEPTGNLDSMNGEVVMELLRELHGGGATICMVTHDPRYAAQAERSIHLFDGRIVEDIRVTNLGGFAVSP